MCNASAAGNRSGAADASTSGNRTWTEHLTSPDMAVIAKTNQRALELTNAENKKIKIL